ncbi:DUF3558 domain-containing protein [Streptomyces sp. NBC_01275]|uniref:DUF3558 domain-containing protein n=1 Tax=Streptomyces sp. NBC_01275 TaxID=2903807 RepID=UPI00224DDB5F|nr:DUF3558 domain-containing protein [Streptomyces sp. NBC_01275]MCX4764105.1 DUF3558 domain-containing protein [Streptomyces sp. NBC_01275]
MSEGTMQRRAQRDDRREQCEQGSEQGGERRTSRAGGLNRVLAAAVAVPVMLIAAGCSSDSGSDSSSGSADAAQGAGSSAGASASTAPEVQAAVYQALPEACKVLSKKTLTDLVPKGATSGKEGTSSDTEARASCSWSSLANNGVKGSQFRWLNVSLLRFESDATTGSGEAQAQTYYTKQVKAAQAVSGAKNAKSEPVTGTGDEATAVRYDLKKKEGAFKQQTVVVRVENVVVTLDYNGAGLAGDKTPGADSLATAAKKAAKEAVASVQSANGQGGSGSSDTGTKNPTPSGSASKSASATPESTSKATPKATASTSASASAAKKS